VRKLLEKSTTIRPHDNPKTATVSLAYIEKPNFLIYEWSVFHLDCVGKFSVDNSTVFEEIEKPLATA